MEGLGDWEEKTEGDATGFGASNEQSADSTEENVAFNYLEVQCLPGAEVSAEVTSLFPLISLLINLLEVNNW